MTQVRKHFATHHKTKRREERKGEERSGAESRGEERRAGGEEKNVSSKRGPLSHGSEAFIVDTLSLDIPKWIHVKWRSKRNISREIGW